MSQRDAVYIRAQVGIRKMLICVGANQETSCTSHTLTDTYVQCTCGKTHLASDGKCQLELIGSNF